MKCSPLTLLERGSQGTEKSLRELKLLLSILTWPQLPGVFAGRLQMSLHGDDKLQKHRTAAVDFCFFSSFSLPMSVQECLVLILKRLQRYLERFEGRSTELYPLSEERRRNRDTLMLG